MYYIALCNDINVSLSSVRTDQTATDGAEQVLYREGALSVPLSLDLWFFSKGTETRAALHLFVAVHGS